MDSLVVHVGGRVRPTETLPESLPIAKLLGQTSEMKRVGRTDPLQSGETHVLSRSTFVTNYILWVDNIHFMAQVL